jgi:tape measure domain-containing protein
MADTRIEVDSAIDNSKLEKGLDEARQKTEQAASAMGEALGGVAEAADEASEAAQRHADKLAEAEKQFEANRQTLSQLRAELKEASSQYGETDERTVALRESFHKAQGAVMLTGKELKSLRSEAESAGTAEEKLGESTEQASKKTDNLKDSLGKANQQIDLQKSALMLVEAEYKGAGDSAQKFSDINNALSGVMDAQKQKIAVLTAALDEAKTKYGETDSRVVALETALNKENAQLVNNAAAVSQNKAKIDELGKSAETLVNKSDELQDAVGNASQQINLQKSALLLVEAEYKGAGDAAQKFKDINAALSGVMDAQKEKIAILASQLDEAKTKYGETDSRVAALETALNNERAELAENAAAFKQNNKELNELGKKSDEASEKSHKLKDALGAVGKAAAVVGAAVAAAGVAIGKALTDAVAATVESGVEYNKAIETYRAGFSTLLGDVQAGEALLAEVAQFAADTPFELPGLAQSAQTLLSFGVSSEEVMDDLKMLGDISMGSQEKLNGLAVVFGQVASAGKLNGQDLNQMINNGFNPLNIIAEQTGLSMSDLRDKMADGAISFDMVSEAMKIATSEGGLFFGAMEAQSATLEGQLATLNDNFNALAGSITSGLTAALTNEAVPAVNQLIAAIDAMVAGNENAEEMLESASQAISDAVGNMIPVVMEMLGTFGEIGLELINTLAKSISDNQDALIQTAITLIDGLIAGITSVLDVLIPVAAALLGKLVEGLVKALPSLVDGAILLLGALGQAIIDNLPLLLEAAIQIIAKLAKDLADELPTLIPTIVKLVMDLVQMLVDNAPLLLDAALALITGLAKGLIDSLPVLIEALPDLIDGIIDFLIESTPMIAEAGIDLFVALVKSLPEIIVKLNEAIFKIIGDLIDTFDTSDKDFMEEGKKLLVNVWNGIVAVGGWLQEQINGFFQGIVDAIGDIFSGKKTLVGSFGVADEIKNDTPKAVAAAKERNDEMIAESKRYQDQQDAERDAANAKHYSNEKEMAKASSDAFKALTEENTKDREKAAKAAEKAAKDAYDHEKLLIEDYRNSADYSIEGEIAMWEKLGQSHKEVSNEKVEIEKSISKLREDLAKRDEKAIKASYDESKLAIEDYQNNVEYSIEEEIAMWEKLGESYTELSKEKVEIDKSLSKLREDLRKRDEKAAKDAYDYEKLLIADYQNSAEHSIQGEIAMWEKLGESYQEVSKEKVEIDKTVAKLREELRKDEEKAAKQAIDDRIDLIKDTEYREIDFATETFKGKIKLLDEEYIAKVRLTDETLAASMEAYNKEQQAIIDTIALTDEQTAKRLQDIKDQKDAILDESKAAKEAREAEAYAEKEADFQRKIAAAEAAGDWVKAQETRDAYYKWLDEQAYKADEADRDRRVKALDDETKDILAEAKKRDDALGKQASKNEAGIKETTDDYTKDLKKNGLDDAKQDLTDIETGYKNLEKTAVESAAKIVSESEKGQKAAQETLKKYYPEYQNKGKKFVDYLIEGQKANEYKVVAEARDIGAMTGDGYISGLESRRSAIEDTIRSIFAEANQAAADEQEIASPSKKYAYFARMDAEGFIGGIKERLGDVRAAAAEMGRAAYMAAQSAVTTPTAGAAASAINNHWQYQTVTGGANISAPITINGVSTDDRHSVRTQTQTALSRALARGGLFSA